MDRQLITDYVDGASASNLLRNMIRAASVNPPGREQGVRGSRI